MDSTALLSHFRAQVMDEVKQTHVKTSLDIASSSIKPEET